MDSPRWQRIQELFEAALTLPENEWNEFLIARCEADADLMDIVSAMLQANKRESPLLDSSLDRIAFEILINDEDHERTLVPTRRYAHWVKAEWARFGWQSARMPKTLLRSSS